MNSPTLFSLFPSPLCPEESVHAAPNPLALPLSLLAGYVSLARLSFSVLDAPASDTCFLLILRKGHGILLLDGREYPLRDGCVCFFPCHSPFSLRNDSGSPWLCQFLFLSGPAAACYCSTFAALASAASGFAKPDSVIPGPVAEYAASCADSDSALSRLPPHAVSILHLPASSIFFVQVSDFCRELPNRLSRPVSLNLLLTELLTGLLTEASVLSVQAHPPVPLWLTAIRDDFCAHYARAYTLDGLEEASGISKFRIVREFTAAFGQSPIAFLNERRMKEAARLLLETDDRINEIGSAVGIDNTNHFIQLFRRTFHMTPGAFRRRHRQSDPARSLSQPSNR